MTSTADQSAEVRLAADRLRSGGLVAFPTETVYGLGADALSAPAVERVFRLKGRPPNNPLIVHVDGEAMARRVVRVWPESAARLARAFWPGPLTLVLPKAASVPSIVTGGGDSVAVRCPDHPLALALIAQLTGPIVGPSANPSGTVSPTTAEHVRRSFTDEEVLVLDGGPCRVGVESTVLSLVPRQPLVLRTGAISPGQIEQVVGAPVAVDHGPAATDRPLPSPGRLPSHYAPRARAVLFESDAELHDIARSEESIVAILAIDPGLAPPPAPQGRTSARILLRMPTDAVGYAARLYAALREADDLGAGLIAIERPGEPGGMWDAVRDRLSRVTAPRA